MDYSYLYSKLNLRTPLKADCGELCSNACCKDDESGEECGMYLFPGEEVMFSHNDNFKIEESDFSYGSNFAKIIFCNSFCKRKERPLSCRIFPLVPYVDENWNLKVIIDKRGRGLCPLCNVTLSEFNHSFVRGVRHIGEELLKEKDTAEFLYALSRLIDEWEFL